MTDLNKKEKIICALCYLAYAAILTYQRHFLLSIAYFAFVAVVIVFADKLLKNEFLKRKTFSAFLITAVGYQTLFEIFYSSRQSIKQLSAALAVAIFIACIFAFTDRKKLPFCIIAAPVLCFLNLKIAVGYTVFLFCISLAELQSEKSEGEKKLARKQENKKTSVRNLSLASIAISVICLGVCIYLSLTSEVFFKEDINYLLLRFKNPLALMIVCGYLAFRIFKSDFYAKQAVIICLVLSVAVAIFATFTLGWSLFSLFCYTTPLYLGLMCIKSTSIVEAIKADYHKNKFVFWAIIVCTLQ